MQLATLVKTAEYPIFCSTVTPFCFVLVLKLCSDMMSFLFETFVLLFPGLTPRWHVRYSLRLH